jgi:N-acetylglucosaminyl-diphospho-decaprenol L-rhamnosyltransferase
MKLSVIIVTHNSAGVLEACWRSVRSSLSDAEIIVVDNASSDDTQRMCEELDGVRLIADGVNAGFGRACNQGAESATGSHILFLNPDVEIRQVDLPALQSESDLTPFGLVSPVIRSAGRAGSTVQPWTRELLHHVAGPLRPHELPAMPQLPIRRRTWWPIGAALLVDREEFDRIGGFDRRFFLYYEDLDLARRYRVAGLPVRITAAVCTEHRHGSSSVGETSGVAVRHGWSYLSWIEYLCIWYGPDTAARAARWARALRAQVNRALELGARHGPLSRRLARKRSELAELDSFIRWQCSSEEGTAAADFCPQAREILAAL